MSRLDSLRAVRQRTQIAQVAARLEAGRWLAPEALIYAESPAREALPPLPMGWTVAKTGRAGEVGYHLFRRAQ